MIIQSVLLVIAVSVTLIYGPASAQSSPQTLIAGMVLEAGEIDSSQVKLGAYAEVIYGTGEQDQVSGKWEKLDTVEGYIKAVDAERLTIGRGLWKEQIAFERIQKLIMAASDREIDRLKETTDTLSVIDDRRQGQNSTGGGRIAKKLAGGVLGGFLFGLAGGTAAAAITDCTQDETFCELGNFVTGGWYGYVVGVPVGMSSFDPYDQFKYSLAGSLIGGAASLVVFKKVETTEELWPVLFISPLIGAAVMSEVFRKPLENRRVSIGLLPGPNGRVSAVATLRF